MHEPIPQQGRWPGQVVRGFDSGTLTLHADRGSSMRSKPVAALLVDLGVIKTHSRPQVSDKYN
jgi:transposase InsO family protein